MRKINSVLCLVLIIASITSAQDFKRYQFKSGKVVYKSSGTMVGTETMYFDNYGMLEVKNTKVVMELMGTKQETDTKVLMTGNVIYSIDNNTGNANKMINPLASMFPEGGDLEKIGDELMKNMGGKKIGSETITGKDCEIWVIEKMMSKVWVWESIPMKTVVNMMGMNLTQVATSVEVDIDVSAEEFKIPKGIKIQDLGNIDINSLMGN
jgi:hypothetical protein